MNLGINIWQNKTKSVSLINKQLKTINEMTREERQMMNMKNSLIRGTIYMLNDDSRMEHKDMAYQFLMDVTNATTEDDIIPLLRGKTYPQLMEINIKVASYLTPIRRISVESSLTCEIYKSY
tara:strand:- start:569 stop:934 length:366 start_codon:yes stop_codon:yes gene_type:complete